MYRCRLPGTCLLESVAEGRRRAVSSYLLARLADVDFDSQPMSPSQSGCDDTHVRIRFGASRSSDLRGCRVAVKQVSLSRARREPALRLAASRLRDEAALLARAAGHPNILRCFGLFEDVEEGDEVLSLVTEACEGGTLASVKARPKAWLPHLADVASAISHLHARGLVHRGLKPAKIFLTAAAMAPHMYPSPPPSPACQARSPVRIGDFDRALHVGDGPGLLCHDAETLMYHAPEVLAWVQRNSGTSTGDTDDDTRAPYCGKAADVYSFAMLTHELLEDRPLHRHLLAPDSPGSWTRNEFINAVMDPMNPLRPTADPALVVEEGPEVLECVRQLVRDCWNPDPSRRPTFDHIHTKLSELANHTMANGSSSSGGGVAKRKEDDSVPGRSALGEQPIVPEKVGHAAICGRRSSMEDTHYSSLLPTHAIVAVFDGHCGADVAAFAKARLEEGLTPLLQSRAPLQQQGLSPVASERETVALASPLCAAADLALATLRALEETVHRELGSTTAGFCGATATVAVVDHTHLSVAWLGDSEAVLCQRSTGASPAVAAHLLTTAHRPSLKAEAERVEAAGGVVRCMTRTLGGIEYPWGPPRVYSSGGTGGLAVSRALGDCALRPIVSGEPEVRHLERDPSRDLFLIVATDGVWDVLSPYEACAIVVGCSKGTAAEASQRLVDEAHARGSQDNATAAIVFLC